MIHKLIAFLIGVVTTSASHHWDYQHQYDWPETYCFNTINQSPIDLKRDELTKTQMEPLQFNHWDRYQEAKLSNNGHTVVVEPDGRYPITMTGGGLPGLYELVQFHFHWGSEHTINGNRHPLEAHFVTYNRKYGSIEKALQHEDGIAVLGVIYQETGHPNYNFDPIVNNLGNISNAGDSVSITISPETLWPREITKFYRYQGSLTTPDCNDVVVWTIFSELDGISWSQVMQFKTVRDSEGWSMHTNFRHTQPRNGRTVYLVTTPDLPDGMRDAYRPRLPPINHDVEDDNSLD